MYNNKLQGSRIALRFSTAEGRKKYLNKLVAADAEHFIVEYY